MTTCSRQPLPMWIRCAMLHPVSTFIANTPWTLRRSMRKQILHSSTPCLPRPPSLPRSPLSTSPVPSKASSGLSSSNREQDLERRLTRSQPQSAQAKSAVTQRCTGQSMQIQYSGQHPYDFLVVVVVCQSHGLTGAHSRLQARLGASHVGVAGLAACRAEVCVTWQPGRMPSQECPHSSMVHVLPTA